MKAGSKINFWICFLTVAEIFESLGSFASFSKLCTSNFSLAVNSGKYVKWPAVYCETKNVYIGDVSKISPFWEIW